ncbi:6-phosphofructokinase [Tautonia plasticadhaerens]|uniref:6-phosphofructokinase n=1 Tax=Tautonia plasticadhaerens TaxID=2527974 RepID=A0A518HBR0_9BACT|nr:6-phosphofructokinase [Tautonia plasticadhaerens]QDV38267.1 6-phosphofructokinase [Tautonia plasticadhaerens]
MKRIGILTAGGDTPALNATIAGAVERANQLRIEVFGLIKGFSGLLNPEVPHVHLNPLFQVIPELDAARGGTILGASRDYVASDDRETIERVVERLNRLGVEGLICVGGDGTLNGMQALCDYLPAVLAPKTIDNDLGLNYPDESTEFVREPDESSTKGFRDAKRPERPFELEEMVNFATPGFATSVFVSAQNVQRIRTTAESHRRVAIIEVMGRDCGMIALGTAFGQPDMILVPEVPVIPEAVVTRVLEILDRQKHAVLVVSEGIKDAQGNNFGAVRQTKDPAGNLQYSGAAEAVKQILVEHIGDAFFTRKRRNESADAAIFCRKIGHTQRGGRPIRFDRYQASQLGGESVDLLVEGRHNHMATLQYRQGGFVHEGIDASRLRDRWGVIHARPLSRSFYDEKRFGPSSKGVAYLQAIFSDALGSEDLESQRPLFDTGNLVRPYDSVNFHVNKRIRRLPPQGE